MRTACVIIIVGIVGFALTWIAVGVLTTPDISRAWEREGLIGWLMDVRTTYALIVPLWMVDVLCIALITMVAVWRWIVLRQPRRS